MSLPGRILTNTNIFKPALHYLSALDPSKPSNNESLTPKIRHSDPDDIDSSPPGPSAYLPPIRRWHSRDSSGDLEPNGGAIPLIDYSRTPSPSSIYRTRSATQSEDEDDGSVPVSLRPLVAREERGWWWNVTKSESLGGFLFGTWLGWQVYVVLLVVWSFGVGFTLVLMNRFILWTGVYKFPYPLAATWLQLAFTHGFLIVAASITRGLAQPLRRLGLSSLISPSHPPNSRGSDLRGRRSLNPLCLFSCFISKTGGIAGGGLFEFDGRTAWAVTPLAVVYVGKVVLSNISYA